MGILGSSVDVVLVVVVVVALGVVGLLVVVVAAVVVLRVVGRLVVLRVVGGFTGVLIDGRPTIHSCGTGLSRILISIRFIKLTFSRRIWAQGRSKKAYPN